MGMMALDKCLTVQVGWKSNWTKTTFGSGFRSLQLGKLVVLWKWEAK